MPEFNEDSREYVRNESLDSLGKRGSGQNASKVFSDTKQRSQNGHMRRGFPAGTNQRTSNFRQSGTRGTEKEINTCARSENDTVPPLTTDSGYSSSNQEERSGTDSIKSESPDQQRSDDLLFDNRLPTLEKALHSVNLHLRNSRPSTNVVLPSMRDDKRVQLAFSAKSIPEYKHDVQFQFDTEWKEERRSSEHFIDTVDSRRSSESDIQRRLSVSQPSSRSQQLSSSEYQEGLATSRGGDIGSNVNIEPPKSAVASSSSRTPAPASIKDGDDIVSKIALPSSLSSSVRPFRCPYDGCEWSFLRSSDQKRHLRSHKKPLLQCPYWGVDPSCHRNGGAFNRLDVLKRHLKLMHYNTDKGGEEGTCKVCQSKFATLRDFIEHAKGCAAEKSHSPSRSPLDAA